ncbi:NADH-quinone oxidoreductase subunit M [Phormidium sp. LEGE 05292]|uniref:NADH-quinone oxidoreductase subunit M n=1 Tax=[Phormidium] sp. LEGE 05292 TaxID=767427 RepID=UPI001880326A|nr:NADH-quinone oxidoreductase subunit M [Phormidium sp. LEGE 05292]MBE9226299.1 NADH-quinone oxidoreductase subunit M [Phormidium sp. LEGE 05292]
MLSTLIWLPVIGAAIIGVLPQEKAARNARNVALIVASIIFFWTLFVLSKFSISNPGFQFTEYLPWIETLGLSYHLGIDGISLPLVVLNSLLIWIVIFSSGDKIARPKLYYSLILLVSSGLAGSFLAQNLLLFVLFYEIELIPLYLLIAIWGGLKREYAAIKFLLYTAVSGILILAAFLALGWLAGSTIKGSTLNFDYETIKSTILPFSWQIPLLITLLIGFGIKTPLVPFHTWLPDAYVEASPPIAILLGGVLAKLGTYGLVRFCLGLFPDAWGTVAPSLAIWATASVVYGALTAIAQKDIKRMVAYSSIGHMGYVLLGLAPATPLGTVGAVAQMFSHGVILAALFYLVGVVEEKVGTRELDVLNGLMNPIRGLPFISAFLVAAGMASAGIPGLVGFIAEFVVFQGAYATFPIPTLICVVGTMLTGVYFVILLNRTCFGKLDNSTAYYPKVLWSERVPALILVGLTFFLGVQPSWLMRWSEQSSTALVASVQVHPEQQIAKVIEPLEK